MAKEINKEADEYHGRLEVERIPIQAEKDKRRLWLAKYAIEY